MKVLFLVFGFAVAFANAAVEYAPTVELKDGKVRGLVQSAESHKVYLYQGIRYGQAKRFSAPEPVKPWSEVYDATRPRFACPQEGFPVSDNLPLETGGIVTHVSNEDCLFLNVWQPAEEKSNRSVMVWIHGGGFYTGTIFAGAHDGRYISTAGDVVVVAINYRLGALGFLYGEEADAPGNVGLRDQIFALQWVRDNIQHFGGNPADVTIFGESAGSMSVGALVLSPLAKGLFHRAILQSGAPNAYLGSQDKKKALPKLIALAGKFSCPYSSYHGLIACLRNKTTTEILKADKNSILNGESFIPIYGDDLLPTRPVEALKAGKFNQDVDLLFGLTSGEGAGFVTGYIPQLSVNSDGHEFTLDTTNKMVAFLFQIFQEPYFQEVADFYTKHLTNDTSKDDFKRTVSDSFGDYHLICPTVLFAEEIAKVNPQKRHYYSYRLTHAPAHGCHGWMGVCHAEDVVFMFGQPILHKGTRYSSQDHQLAVDMVRAWTDFAKTGNPGKMGNNQWEEAFGKSASVEFMQLDPVNYQMVPNFFKEKCDGFWKSKIFV